MIEMIDLYMNGMTCCCFFDFSKGNIVAMRSYFSSIHRPEPYRHSMSQWDLVHSHMHLVYHDSRKSAQPVFHLNVLNSLTFDIYVMKERTPLQVFCYCNGMLINCIQPTHFLKSFQSVLKARNSQKVGCTIFKSTSSRFW